MCCSSYKGITNFGNLFFPSLEYCSLFSQFLFFWIIPIHFLWTTAYLCLCGRKYLRKEINLMSSFLLGARLADGRCWMEWLKCGCNTRRVSFFLTINKIVFATANCFYSIIVSNIPHDKNKKVRSLIGTFFWFSVLRISIQFPITS